MEACLYVVPRTVRFRSPEGGPDRWHYTSDAKFHSPVGPKALGPGGAVGSAAAKPPGVVGSDERKESLRGSRFGHAPAPAARGETPPSGSPGGFVRRTPVALTVHLPYALIGLAAGLLVWGATGLTLGGLSFDLHGTSILVRDPAGVLAFFLGLMVSSGLSGDPSLEDWTVADRTAARYAASVRALGRAVRPRTGIAQADPRPKRNRRAVALLVPVALLSLNSGSAGKFSGGTPPPPRRRRLGPQPTDSRHDPFFLDSPTLSDRELRRRVRLTLAWLAGGEPA